MRKSSSFAGNSTRESARLSTATGEPSRRSLWNARRGRSESPAAARRSRTSRANFARGIQTFRDCAGRWWTGRRNSGSCKWPKDWPPLRHVWPLLVRAAPPWRVSQRCRDRAVAPRNRDQRKKPAAVEAGRARRGRSMLRVDPIGSLAALRFEGFDGVSGLLHRAGHEPANGVLLPTHLLHNLRQRGAVLPLEHGDHLGSFAAFARPGDFVGLGRLLGVGRLLRGSGLLGRRGLLRRALWLRCANVGYGLDDFAGAKRRQSNGFDFSLECGIFEGASRFCFRALRLGYRQLRWRGFRVGRVNFRLRSGRCCRLLSEALKRLPDALGRRLPIGKLGDRLHVSEAIPDLDQPLVVGSDQVGPDNK